MTEKIGKASDSSCVAFTVRVFTSVRNGRNLLFLSRPNDAAGPLLQRAKMPKKKSGKLDKQLNVRVATGTYERIEHVADKLGIDPSDLVRMILNENLPTYEDRVSRLTRPAPGQPGNSAAAS